MTGVMFAGSELAGNGLELDSEMSENRWSPYNRHACVHDGFKLVNRIFDATKYSYS
jgi:hypothetical protein